jgi:exonuclease III
VRIVSWNCNGGFRRKYQKLLQYKADLYVIQECENPADFNDAGYKKFAANSLWVSENKNKGLGIFASSQATVLEKNLWDTYMLYYFISCRVNKSFDLLAVWACKPYIATIYEYLSRNHDKMNENCIVIGDFNSNKMWDDEHGFACHTVVEKRFNKLGLYSCDTLKDKTLVDEKTPTFYLHKHLDRPYHIDYCFLKPERLKQYDIGKEETWLEMSDHMPLVVDVDNMG